MITEQAMRDALEGHFYVMHYEMGAKVIDAGDGVEPQHPPRPWTDDDLRLLWRLKQQDLSDEEIVEEMGRGRRCIVQVWARRKLWKDRLLAQDPPPAPPLHLKAIRRAVCEVIGLTEAEFAGRSRSRKAAEARQIYFWIARTFTARSTTQIADYAGNRDHSTVLHGIAKIEDSFETFRDRVALILFELGLSLTDRKQEAA